MRVLVVEDDEDVSLLCRLALEGAGHDVTTAGSGAEMMNGPLHGNPDLIVLDGMLPDADGLEILERLAGDEATRRIPVVMASARVGRTDRLAALRGGASAYVMKPFDPATIVSVIEEVARLDPMARDDARRLAIDAMDATELQARTEVEDRPVRAIASSSTLSQVLSLAFDAIVSVDEDQRIVGFNKGAETIFGYLAEEVLGKSLDMLIPERLVAAHHDHIADFASERGSGRQMGLQRNVFGRRRDGSEFPAEASITKLDVDGRPVLTAILRDATERQRTEAELRNRARQQAAVAALGQRALTTVDSSVLLDDAARILQQVLGVDFASILSLESDGLHLLLTAGVGWDEGYVGTHRIEASRISPGGFALESDTPIVFEDLSRDVRFGSVDHLSTHGVVSGMSVALHGRVRALGAMAVYARRSRAYTSDDVHVLQAIANIVASAIQRDKDERRIRAFLDAAPDATLVVDQTGQVVSANAQAEVLFGYTRDELLRIGVDALVPEQARMNHAANRANYADEHRSRAMGEGLVLAARRKDGSEVPVDIMLRPLDTDEGPLVVAAVRDVTERRRNEAVRDAFLHAVSHELRTPLTSVIGFSSLLVDHYGDTLPGESLGLAERIRSSARRLERLLSDLLDLDRLARGVLEAQRRRVLIAEAIGHTVDALATGDRTVRVTVDPPDLQANIDPAQFERIVENLVVNALRHTPESTSVDVRVAPSANGILLIVEDDGPGVSPEMRDQIFEPFHRDVGGAAIPGTGIGLSLVARFAELHGGRAWVEDAPGGGASFRVVLGS